MSTRNIRRGLNPSIIRYIAEEALVSAPSLVRDWLPGGRFSGGEYVVRNPNRSDEHPGSFSVNVRTGRWADFATGDGGGDLVSLLAYINGCSQTEAAYEIADQLSLEVIE